MPKVIDAKSWQLTPASDGRRYSKYPDGNIGFSVSAYTDGASSDIAYQIYDPVAETWGDWINGVSGGVGGVTTQVTGTALAGPFVFTDQTGVALNTVIESDAETISSEGHQVKLRRRSSTSNDAARTAYAVIDGVESTAWTVTTEVSGDPPSATRDDILVEIAFNSYEADEFNPPRMDSGEADKAVDGFRMDNIGNGSWPVSQAVQDLPHMEIRGASVGADYAAAGEHVLEGDRALLLTLYHPGHDPAVDYEGSYLGRARLDAYITSYLSTLFSTERYSASQGYNTEFWIGMAIWLPDDFIFDSGVGSNHSFMTFGDVNDNANFSLSMPAASSPRWECDLRNFGGVTGTERNLNWLLDSAEQTKQRGTHNCWVFHVKPDSTGNTGFFRGWHNVVGEEPVLRMSETNVRFGYTASGTMKCKAFASYKSGIYSTWGTTYGGDWTDPDHKLVVGIDSWRLGGDQSNFRSVHPLQQEAPE